ncbi:hypothetical protein D3C78_1962860 [compost metagenome]
MCETGNIAPQDILAIRHNKDPVMICLFMVYKSSSLPVSADISYGQHHKGWEAVGKMIENKHYDHLK